MKAKEVVMILIGFSSVLISLLTLIVAIVIAICQNK